MTVLKDLKLEGTTLTMNKDINSRYPLFMSLWRIIITMNMGILILKNQHTS
jgi:hypothetical protein